ncbi:hypothetical protein [Ammoniphilus resinae]|uniref:Uncharacterized protein n=1 Tax=Ammoniphilus resinae TaxID=861532 RepID=A0ABS4GXV5_9BACL|nr:hypothetical protein [Ammoniphilus resinae]MBP1935102.1 hypothetical protein [Ammoniphilus resinae]
MIQSILSYLKSDSELSSLLQPTAQNPKIFEFEHSDLIDDPYIIYNYNPVNVEATTQNRVEFRVVSLNPSTMDAIAKAIMRLMNFKNKPGFISNGESIYHSAYVGGGRLKDPDDKTHQQILIFNVKSN